VYKHTCCCCCCCPAAAAAFDAPAAAAGDKGACFNRGFAAANCKQQLQVCHQFDNGPHSLIVLGAQAYCPCPSACFSDTFFARFAGAAVLLLLLSLGLLLLLLLPLMLLLLLLATGVLA
jgi:hypothetical protein